MLEKIVIDDLTVTEGDADQCDTDHIDMDNIHTTPIGERVIFKAPEKVV